MDITSHISYRSDTPMEAELQTAWIKLSRVKILAKGLTNTTFMYIGSNALILNLQFGHRTLLLACLFVCDHREYSDYGRDLGAIGLDD